MQHRVLAFRGYIVQTTGRRSEALFKALHTIHAGINTIIQELHAYVKVTFWVRYFPCWRVGPVKCNAILSK